MEEVVTMGKKKGSSGPFCLCDDCMNEADDGEGPPCKSCKVERCYYKKRKE